MVAMVDESGGSLISLFWSEGFVSTCHGEAGIMLALVYLIWSRRFLVLNRNKTT